MMKNHKLAKSIQELGLYELRRQLEYKSKWNNRELILVSRWFPSSKTCSSCGEVKKDLKLSERTFKCQCGFELDRDLNAAINIEKEGQKILIRQRLPKSIDVSQSKLVDNPTMDDKDISPLKSSG